MHLNHLRETRCLRFGGGASQCVSSQFKHHRPWRASFKLVPFMLQRQFDDRYACRGVARGLFADDRGAKAQVVMLNAQV